MTKFEMWLENFKQTPEYFADTFTWGDMAKAAYVAGEEGADKETLRDKFAMAALQGMLASPFDVREENLEGSVTDHFAKVSYNYADSMLKMRDIRRTSGQSD